MSTKKLNKKGISPLIATVIIIGFTIVLAAAVIYWGTGFFKTIQDKTSRGATISNLCTSDLAGLEFSTKINGGKLDITVDNTKNAAPINGYILTLEKAGVKSATLFQGVSTVAVTSFKPKFADFVGSYSIKSLAGVSAVFPAGFAVGDKVTLKAVVRADPSDPTEVPSVCQNELEITTE